ncbi:MAG: TOBE domain-containing protein, partial [Chloroflexota bacterium]
RVTQPLGPFTLATVDWDGGSLTARMPGMAQLAPGQRVGVRLDPAGVRFFDRESGRLVAG